MNYKMTVYAGNIGQVEDVEGYESFLEENFDENITLDFDTCNSGACSDHIEVYCSDEPGREGYISIEYCLNCEHKCSEFDEEELKNIKTPGELWEKYCNS